LDVALEVAFESEKSRESQSRSVLDIHDDTDSCIGVKKVNKVRPLAELPECPSKPPLAERPLLEIETAAELARVYETLANDTRLRLLHVLLKDGEITPSGLAAKLGMKPQAVSNQLQRLSDRGIVQTRRDGNNVLYRIVDPCVIELIDRGLCLLEETRAVQTRLE
jgi:ArsR family transcriptional regulator, lead/cadmium/zinc/bismuth-responsive transcriptional repressor